MRTAETVAGLAAFTRRGAGTDAERRAASWLRSELDAGRRQAELEPFWCRPNWALAQAWHVGLGLAGSLVSVSLPWLGGVLVLIAILSVIADTRFGVSPGRRLTPERASQNVVGRVGPDGPGVRLIVTANYDAGRMGLVHRSAARSTVARLKRLLGGAVCPGWTGWLVLALVWVLVAVIVRVGGAHGIRVGIVQLIPTVVLAVALALLLDLAGAEYGPSAGDNASGVAVALALVRALDVGPPRHLTVEVVLQGASDGAMLGLHRHLRARRPELGADTAVVLGIAPCGAGQPRWWVSDGALIPLRYDRRLTALCAGVADTESHLGAAPHRGRGIAPALPARVQGLPAIAIGCLDARGLVPRGHQPGDTADQLDPTATDLTLELALALVDAIDAGLWRTAPATPAAPAAPVFRQA
jgi:Peptidase family M28